jgi:hypothetical protein
MIYHLKTRIHAVEKRVEDPHLKDANGQPQSYVTRMAYLIPEEGQVCPFLDEYAIEGRNVELGVIFEDSRLGHSRVAIQAPFELCPEWAIFVMGFHVSEKIFEMCKAGHTHINLKTMTDDEEQTILNHED